MLLKAGEGERLGGHSKSIADYLMGRFWKITGIIVLEYLLIEELINYYYYRLNMIEGEVIFEFESKSFLLSIWLLFFSMFNFHIITTHSLKDFFFNLLLLQNIPKKQLLLKK